MHLRWLIGHATSYLPRHAQSGLAIVGRRVSVGADLIADIGKERCGSGNLRIHAGIQFEPAAANIRLEGNRTGLG